MFGGCHRSPRQLYRVYRAKSSVEILNCGYECLILRFKGRIYASPEVYFRFEGPVIHWPSHRSPSVPTSFRRFVPCLLGHQPLETEVDLRTTRNPPLETEVRAQKQSHKGESGRFGRLCGPSRVFAALHRARINKKRTNLRHIAMRNRPNSALRGNLYSCTRFQLCDKENAQTLVRQNEAGLDAHTNPSTRADKTHVLSMNPKRKTPCQSPRWV